MAKSGRVCVVGVAKNGREEATALTDLTNAHNNCIVVKLGRDRNHHDLTRGQPKWPRNINKQRKQTKKSIRLCNIQ